MTKRLTDSQYKDRPCLGAGCDRILRSKGYPKELAPGTHRASGLGMCARCYSRVVRDLRPVTGSSDDVVTRAHKADVEAWLDARRRRGIPAEGIGYGVAA